MLSSQIDIQTADGVADCYLTRPDDQNHPGVLLMIDAFGLRPQIEQMADRIAADGYVVLAPNAFYRAGRAPLWEIPDMSAPDARASFFETVRPLMMALTFGRISSDGDAYLDYLGTVADSPVGVTGYCMGARLAWMIAASHPDRVAAVGGFHGGGMVTDSDDSAHLLADRIKAEVYWGHADHDENMSPVHIAALNQAMDAAGVHYTTEVYVDAPHGYTMADLPPFREESAERHFDALSSLFGRTLG